MTGGNNIFWVGHDIIDGNNSRLIDVYKLSAQQLETEIDADRRCRILDRIVSYTFNHFEVEEKHMNINNYPNLSPHQEAHLLYSCSMVRLYMHFRERYVLGEMLSELVREMCKHIVVFDRAYARYLTNQQSPGDL